MVGRSSTTYELTGSRDVRILLRVGRRAHGGDHQRAMGNPGLVRGRRCAMIAPPQTIREVPLCHLETMTGSR